MKINFVGKQSDYVIKDISNYTIIGFFRLGGCLSTVFHYPARI